MTSKRCHRCGHARSRHKRGLLGEVVRDGSCVLGWRNASTVDGGWFWYAYGPPGSECDCPGYVEAPRERVRRGLRSVKVGAKSEEIARRAGPGRMDLATEDAAIEVKTGTATIRKHIEQARRLAGNREPVVRYVFSGEVWDLREVRTG